MPSTVVAGIKYNPRTRILQVEFVSGSIYEYIKVDEKVYQELKSSSSKGTFLNIHIKGNYDFKKIR